MAQKLLASGAQLEVQDFQVGSRRQLGALPMKCNAGRGSEVAAGAPVAFRTTLAAASAFN